MRDYGLLENLQPGTLFQIPEEDSDLVYVKLTDRDTLDPWTSVMRYAVVAASGEASNYGQLFEIEDSCLDSIKSVKILGRVHANNFRPDPRMGDLFQLVIENPESRNTLRFAMVNYLLNGDVTVEGLLEDVEASIAQAMTKLTEAVREE